MGNPVVTYFQVYNPTSGNMDLWAVHEDGEITVAMRDYKKVGA